MPPKVTSKFVHAQPTLLVRDVSASARFYVDKLGFFVPGYVYSEDGQRVGTTVERDAAVLHLSQAIDARHVVPLRNRAARGAEDSDVLCDLTVFLEGVVDYWHAIAGAGATIIKEPREQYQATLIVEDCDGYYLGFVENPTLEAIDAEIASLTADEDRDTGLTP
jgi:catechol 2,3-dioxygenase-like lactoylglutathione lyase family enzyme